MSDRDQFRDPLAGSVTFRKPELPLLGGLAKGCSFTYKHWLAAAGYRLHRGTFSASFSFLEGGNYTYEVRQMDPSGPDWQLRVNGRYETVSNATTKDLGIAVRLIPAQAQFVPGRGSVNQASELARLLPDGLPDTVPAVLDVFQADASEIWINCRNSGSDLHLARSASTPTPARLRLINAASSQEGAIAPGSLITIFGATLEPGEVSARPDCRCRRRSPELV